VNTHPAYADMLTVANLVVRETHLGDVTRHDYRALHQHDNTRARPFVWAAHEGGTFLCWCDVRTIDAKGSTPADYVRFVENSFPGCEWFIWDGCGLQTCSADGAADYARTFEWCAHV
jgi:hypothetical protein